MFGRFKRVFWQDTKYLFIQQSEVLKRKIFSVRDTTSREKGGKHRRVGFRLAKSMIDLSPNYVTHEILMGAGGSLAIKMRPIR